MDSVFKPYTIGRGTRILLHHLWKVSFLYLKKAVWYEFMILLEINRILQFFFHSDLIRAIYFRQPSTIILDGTALSCRKDLIPAGQQRDIENLPVLGGLSQRQRVFMHQQKARTLLRQFATGRTKNGKEELLSENDLQTLLDKLQDENPHLNQLVLELSENGTVCQAPASYRMLLREIAKNTPVCGLLQVGDDPEIQHLLEEVVNGTLDIASPNDTNKTDILRKKVPGLMECVLPIRKDVGELPLHVRQIVEIIIEKSMLIFNQCQKRTAVHYKPVDSAQQPLAFFPNWPIGRGVGRYDDKARTTADEADTCVKHRHGHKVLGPGIITTVCQHGVCYGFAIMDSYESPKMPFDIFSCRYVPENIIYDNACKLHLYCLRREPLLFRNTRFLVDRLHWANHSACAIGYCLNRYKTDENLISINSQVNEQLNACLVKLRTSLSYMNYDKFVRCLKLFLAFRNRSARSKC